MVVYSLPKYVAIHPLFILFPILIIYYTWIFTRWRQKNISKRIGSYFITVYIFLLLIMYFIINLNTNYPISN